MTIEEFYNEICKLESDFKHRDLEEYLLALYKNLNDNSEIYTKQNPGLDLILCILKESFTSEPANFNTKWLGIIQSPDPNRMCRIFTNPEIKDDFDRTNHSAMGFEFTMRVIEFQIAELHKMIGKQLEDKYKYFGINSESGNRWYNFDPFTNLECGARCMIDNEDEESINWSFIGNLLEDGRVYE